MKFTSDFGDPEVTENMNFTTDIAYLQATEPMNFTSDVGYLQVTEPMNFTTDLAHLRVKDSTSSKNASKQWESHDLVLFVEKYYSFGLLVVGTIGNLLCLAVLSRKTYRRSTIGIYLRFLTLSDLTALYTGALYFTARAVFGLNFRKVNELSCKFHRWLSFVGCDLSSWALVLVSSARLISIAWPMKRLITRRRIYISLLATVTLILAANLPVFIIYGNTQDLGKNKTNLCVFTRDSYEEFYNHVFSWLVLLKFGLLPCVILIVLNTALVVNVYRSGKAISKIQGPHSPSSLKATASIKLSISKWKKQLLGETSLQYIPDNVSWKSSLNGETESSHSNLTLINLDSEIKQNETSRWSWSKTLVSLKKAGMFQKNVASTLGNEGPGYRLSDFNTTDVNQKYASINCSVCLSAEKHSSCLETLPDANCNSNTAECAPITECNGNRTPNLDPDRGDINHTRCQAILEDDEREPMTYETYLSYHKSSRQTDSQANNKSASLSSTTENITRFRTVTNITLTGPAIGLESCINGQNTDLTASSTVHVTDINSQTEFPIVGTLAEARQTNCLICLSSDAGSHPDSPIRLASHPGSQPDNSIITHANSTGPPAIHCSTRSTDMEPVTDCLIFHTGRLDPDEDGNNVSINLTDCSGNGQIVFANRSDGNRNNHNVCTNRSDGNRNNQNVCTNRSDGNRNNQNVCTNRSDGNRNNQNVSTNYSDCSNAVSNVANNNEMKDDCNNNTSSPQKTTMDVSVSSELSELDYHNVERQAGVCNDKQNFEVDGLFRSETTANTNNGCIIDIISLNNDNLKTRDSNMSHIQIVNFAAHIPSDPNLAVKSFQRCTEVNASLTRDNISINSGHSSSTELSSDTHDFTSVIDVSVNETRARSSKSGKKVIKPKCSSVYSRRAHLSSSRRRRESNVGQQASSTISRSKSLTKTLLVLNTVFLVSTTPITVYMTGKTYFWPNTDVYSASLDIVATIANFSMYTNNAINFILYCVTGSKFRGQLILMFIELFHLCRDLWRRLYKTCL